MAINLNTFLQPANGNTFFLIEDKYVKGGLRAVADNIARDAIPANNRKPGMVVVTQNDFKLHVLGLDLLTWTEVTTGGASSLNVSAVGPTADRVLYDTASTGFLFVDETTAQLYVKHSATSGDWAPPISLAQGPIGPQGIPGDLGPIGPQGIQGPIGPQGNPGLVNRGDWGSATLYDPGNVVVYQGSAYSAKSSHSNQLPTNPVYWDLLVAKGDLGPIGPQGSVGPIGPQGNPGLVNRGSWLAITTYAVGDIVVHQGSAYSSLTDNNLNNDPPSATANWALLVAKGDAGIQGIPGAKGLTLTGPWENTTSYAVDDVVVFNGSSYYSKTPANLGNQPDLDTVNWQLLVSIGLTGPQGNQGIQGLQGDPGPQGLKGDPGLFPKGAWAATTTYGSEDIVYYNGSSYYSKVAGNIGVTPGTDSAYWDILVAKGDIGPQGAQGLQGPIGPQGPEGPSGATAYHAPTHAAGGVDEITPVSIGALANTTDTLTGDLTVTGRLHWNNMYNDQASFPPAATSHGLVVHSHADGKMYFAHSGQWFPLAIEQTAILPYDIPFFIAGVPTANTLVGAILVNRPISLFAGLAGSLAKAHVAATAATQLLIKLDGTQIGTISFAAGSAVGVFSFTANTVVSSNQFLEIHTPATVDTTLANIGVTITGYASAPQGQLIP